jgi:hypothetical protein
LNVSRFTVPVAGCAIAADAIIKKKAQTDSKRVRFVVIAQLQKNELISTDAVATQLGSR